MKNEHAKGIVFVVLAATLWSVGGLGIKVVQCDALAISGFRSLFAVPVFLAWIFLTQATPIAAIKAGLSRPLVWAASFSYALTVTFFVLANKLTTAANAILLQYTAPIWVALLSWPLLRERIRAIDVAAIIGSFIGMGFFFGDQLSSTGAVGNIVAVGSGVTFAFLTLLLRLEQLKVLERAAQDPDLARSSHLSAVLAVVLGNIFSVGIGFSTMLKSQPQTTIGWGVLIGLGAVQIGLAYLFYTGGVIKLKAVESTLLSCVEPILNPIWVAIGTGETPSRAALIGGAMIVGSVTARGLWRPSKKETPN